jgi:hypothetical protein
MKPLTPQQQEAIAGAGEFFDSIDADYLPPHLMDPKIPVAEPVVLDTRPDTNLLP